jgi:hypothetical protein
MSNNNEVKWRLPQELTGLVPTAEQILKALGDQKFTYESDRVFVRAVDDPLYVGTASPFKAHRFGLPLELVGDDAKLPFAWVYLGINSLVAA